MLLQSCGQGTAANKIAHLSASEKGYRHAWDLLKTLYTRKRSVISKHTDAILDTAIITAVTPGSLSKILDDAKQNLSWLSLLGVELEPQFIIRVLEHALPKEIREE